VSAFSQQEIAEIEANGKINLEIEGQPVELLLSDVEIVAEDIPGWVVANYGTLTVALDITITDELKKEGFARELVNRIQNYRKESQLEVTDHINISLESHSELDDAFRSFEQYIKTETLCDSLTIAAKMEGGERFEITDEVAIAAVITKA
ncbi:DUF5915 domain-containing protein, partial [Bacteroidales bacterium OttesenSCG-928-A14]|nr:DUF5915 domain-containing protein [Bacteroidales bacterium OttesenSCG-928-A14]